LPFKPTPRPQNAPKAYYFAEADSTKRMPLVSLIANTFVSVLNPSSSLTAHVKATYFIGTCGGGRVRPSVAAHYVNATAATT